MMSRYEDRKVKLSTGKVFEVFHHYQITLSICYILRWFIENFVWNVVREKEIGNSEKSIFKLVQSIIILNRNNFCLFKAMRQIIHLVWTSVAEDLEAIFKMVRKSTKHCSFTYWNSLSINFYFSTFYKHKKTRLESCCYPIWIFYLILCIAWFAEIFAGKWPHQCQTITSWLWGSFLLAIRWKISCKLHQ